MTAEKDSTYVEKWLRENEGFASSYVDKWIQTHPHQARIICDQHSTSVHRRQSLNMFRPTDEGGLLTHHISSPNLHTQRRKKSSSELRQLDRRDLFMELLQDVVSPDFDVNHLSHKILLNVLVLTNADRSSLFLVEGSEESPILVSRLFDVMESTSVEEATHDESEAIKIPFGIGIAGNVAKTGESVNLQNAYEDERFNKDVDMITGYQTKSILCMPIKAPDGQVIGVAQVINKNRGESVFTSEDEQDFMTYLTFCAIGLINSQLLDQSLAFSRRLQVLLQMTRGLFEDTTSMELMMRKIMLESQELIPCEQCTVLLMDPNSTGGEPEDIEFSQIFQMEHAKVIKGSLASIRSLESKSVWNIDVAKTVAHSAVPLNVTLKTSEMAIPPHSTGTKSILCMPITDRDGKLIGVGKLTNKISGLPFNQNDMDSFQVFSAFCGMGILSVMNYEHIVKADARKTVALEVLSFHASAPVEEAEKLMRLQLPSVDSLRLDSFQLDDLTLSDDQTVLASVRMFVDSGHVERFKIDLKMLYRWVLTVRKNYRPVTYHNWRHAFNVAQSMFAMFTSGKLASKLNDIEQFSLLIACLCHDLDHRGTNNAFQAKIDSPLVQLYGTSTMEHHHLDHCIMILNSEGNQILQNVKSHEYNEVIRCLQSEIISTDLALYFKKKGPFRKLVDKKQFDWSMEDHRDLLRGMLMTACDVSAITKPWEIQRRTAELVASEFFEQGDKERTDLQLEPMAMMDRRKKDELPKMQVGFIDAICLPLYQVLYDLLEELNPLLAGCQSNKDSWQALGDNPDLVSHPHHTTELPGPSSSSFPMEAWRSKERLGDGGAHKQMQKRKKPCCTVC